ncbi:MAG: hypothetical protein ACO1N1_00675 [Dyadobacter fermentans]
MGFQCMPANGTDSGWPVIEVADSGGTPMKIFPVALDAWRHEQQTRLPDRLAGLLANARSEGHQAVVLWEDYWIARNAIVLSRIAAMLGRSARIPARLTQVRRIDKAATEQFLTANHLNGNVSSKFRYGLFLPGRYFRVLPADFPVDRSADELLVAVSTFSNARIFMQDDKPFRSHELIRFASLAGTNVVGAFDKLLKAFILEKQPDDIMTYADLEWSDGRSYRQLGFEAKGTIAPRPVYLNLNEMTRSNRPVGMDMASQMDDFVQISNLGSIKYVKTFPNALPDEN